MLHVWPEAFQLPDPSPEAPDLSPEASDLAPSMFYLSLSAFDIAHALFDLSPEAVAEGHAPCSKVYTCRALYHQFQFLYRHPLEPC